MRFPSLFGSKNDENIPLQPDFFDVDGTVYAIGDVHGKLDLLKGLIARLRTDIAREGTAGPKRLIFMGDYVDRGEDSRGVLRYLSELTIPDCEIIFLRGNHEQQMIDFVDDPINKRRWLDWGGMETLQSFNRPPIFATASDEELTQAAKAFGTVLGDLRQFVDDQTVYWWRVGNVVFSHGGMEPSLPIDEQNVKSLLWGSQAFMEHGGPPGYWYVHGHVIHDKPAIIGNRIAVDTGAYSSGILTAARITNDGCAFLEHSE